MTEDVFEIDAAKFLEVNRDYMQRIEKEGLAAIYDATLDTLFIEIGGPREALTEPLIDNMMIRIDPSTLEMVGLEIQDFLDDFVPANRIVRELIKGWSIDRQGDSEKLLIEPGVEEAAKVLTQLALSCVREDAA